MFDRATITLGIGPHSSCHLSRFCYIRFSFFPYYAKSLARTNVFKMTYFVSSEM